MKTTFAVLRSKGVKFGAAVAGSVALVSPAFADVAADIASAQTEGVSNVTLAVGAVISIAAICLGISIIRSILTR